MAPLNYDKVLIAFNNKTVGEWTSSVRNQQVLSFISPISVFISITVDAHRYPSFCILDLAKEVAAILVWEKIIANTQQIVEIACEKKKGNSGVCIFIQEE